MSDWKSIETAPTGVEVELGKWEDDYSGGLAWHTRVGEAWVRGFFGRRKRNPYRGDYSWWRPLPPPPNTGGHQP